jgi:uncharacterized membrane protein YcaP (DUF421 family)
MEFTRIFTEGLDFSLAFEVIFRTFIMFMLILIVLRALGKRGIRQLSLFEVAIIIGLGSAAGDPMFNEDEPILPAIIVFVTICIFYRVITWLAARSDRFERILEGKPIYIIESGEYKVESQDKHDYATDEFFAEMRQQHIEHLGQIHTAMLETNGNVSFIYFADDDVKPGMPIWPLLYNRKSETIPDQGDYACTHCACVTAISATTFTCRHCGGKEWVKAIDTKRIG